MKSARFRSVPSRAVTAMFLTLLTLHDATPPGRHTPDPPCDFSHGNVRDVRDLTISCGCRNSCVAVTFVAVQPTVPESDDPVGATCAVLEKFFERLTCSAKAATMDNLVATELSLSQMRSVFILGSHGSPMSVNELAGELGLSLAAAGRGIDKLVGLGIVDRREDASDRRIKRISLTGKGQEIVDAQHLVKQDLLRDFISRLPAGIRDNLRSALDAVVNGDNDYWLRERAVSTPPTSLSQEAHA